MQQRPYKTTVWRSPMAVKKNQIYCLWSRVLIDRFNLWLIVSVCRLLIIKHEDDTVLNYVVVENIDRNYSYKFNC